MTIITALYIKTKNTILIISRSVLRIRNVLDKICTENQNTHLMFNFFFFFKNRAVYEIMWKYMKEPDRPQMTIWRMRIACCIRKVTNLHSYYVILLVFHNKWLHERASM
jgi:hypothetical protein